MKPTAIDTEALGARAEQMIRAMAPISSEPNRLVRLFLSPEHRRAADLAAGWMQAAGMQVSEDALGTVRGRIGEGPRLLIGSHLDSVIDGGNYDGTLGVIAGILAVEHFVKGEGVPLPIDVLAFGDEEGSRFPSTLSSSSACAGAFETETLALTDRDGITIAEAIRRYGKDPADIPKAAYGSGEAAAYVEVHIEQGPLLETEKEALGVVTGIVGQSRLGATVTGEAGHAGTVPMNLRRDALAGAAAMISMIERVARANSAKAMVATVGAIEATPGATNIIPGAVSFTIDLRAMSDTARHAAVATIQHEARGIAEARKLAVGFRPFHDVAATACDNDLQETLAAAISDLGHRLVHLPSGAGHDAQMLARLCPAAMLFVRCRAGISHNPAEHASIADMGAAVGALIRFIERFAAVRSK